VLLAGVAQTVRGTFAEGLNLTHYVDYRALPGRKRNLYYTNEGLLSTIPAVATTLFGIMAGWLLTSACWSPRQKVAWLVGAGAAGIALGALWSLQIPIIKRIWTPSFCLVASGFSAAMLGAFYLLVDVWQWRKWCVPFLWIGSNALAVYLAVDFIDFAALAERFVGGNVSAFFDTRLSAGFGALVIELVALLLPVLLVRYLYQKKIFIRL
jgi:predicted acyltransferase